MPIIVNSQSSGKLLLAITLLLPIFAHVGLLWQALHQSVISDKPRLVKHSQRPYGGRLGVSRAARSSLSHHFVDPWAFVYLKLSSQYHATDTLEYIALLCYRIGDQFALNLENLVNATMSLPRDLKRTPTVILFPRSTRVLSVAGVTVGIAVTDLSDVIQSCSKSFPTSEFNWCKYAG